MQIEDVVAQVERLVRVGLTILFAYLVALWIAAIWWTVQDIRSRTTDILLQIAATVLVVVFNFPGLLIYLLLRPQRTLAELYDETLEEEALLRTMNGDASCPACGYPIEGEFLFCPSCQSRLRQLCAHCERPLSLQWNICPYCGAPAAPARAPQVNRAAPQVVEPAIPIRPLDQPVPLRQPDVAS